MKMLDFDSWRWPQIAAFVFCTAFLLTLGKGPANAAIIAAASIFFWGPVIWVILYFRRRGRPDV